MHPEVAKVLQCWGAHRNIGGEHDIQLLPTNKHWVRYSEDRRHVLAKRMFFKLRWEHLFFQKWSWRLDITTKEFTIILVRPLKNHFLVEELSGCNFRISKLAAWLWPKANSTLLPFFCFVLFFYFILSMLKDESLWITARQTESYTSTELHKFTSLNLCNSVEVKLKFGPWGNHCMLLIEVIFVLHTDLILFMLLV